MLPSHSVPPDSSWFSRQLDGLREMIREGLASVAKSVAPQVEFLLHQWTITPALSDDWPSGVFLYTNYTYSPPFSSSFDAFATVTTGSTGRLAIRVSGEIKLSITGSGSGDIGVLVEVLDGSSTVVKSAYGQRERFDSPTKLGQSYGAGPLIVASLTPNTTYTIRTRRRFQVWAAEDTVYGFAGTNLEIIQLGM